MKRITKRILTFVLVLSALVLSIGFMRNTKKVGAEEVTYTMTIDSSNNGEKNVHYIGTSITSLTYNNITWDAYVSGTTSFTASKTYCQIGSKSAPATKVELSTDDFVGKTITYVSLTGYCMTNTGPTLKITCGSNELLGRTDLIKTTPTKYEKNNLNVVNGENDKLSFTITSSAKAAIVISEICVKYIDESTQGKTLKNISIKEDCIVKTKYYENEIFDSTGLVLIATYDDDSTEEITDGYTVDKTGALTLEDTSITISYLGQITTLNITINELPTFQFIKVTKSDELIYGDEIIIVGKNNDNYFVLSTNRGDNRLGASIVFSNDLPVYNTNAQRIIVNKGILNSTYSFSTSDGYLYAASSSYNYLKTKEILDEYGSWKLDIENLTPISQGDYTRNLLKFNYNNDNPPIFSCYNSGQTNVSIYKVVQDYSSINYVLNDNDVVLSNEQTKYIPGYSLVKLPNPDLTGSTFLGWYSDASFSEDSKVTIDTIISNDSLTLYAKWQTTPEYTVNFYREDTCENLIDSKTLLSGSTISRPVNNPEPNALNGEYSFDDWYINVNGEDIKFDFDNYVISTDINIFAKWFTLGSSFKSHDTKASLKVGLNAEANSKNCYKKVANASLLIDGLKILIVTSKGFGAGDITSQYLSNISLTISNGCIYDINDSTSFTLVESGTYWKLKNDEGKFLGCTAKGKLAWDSGNTEWNITIDEDGNATIESKEVSFGRFLYNVNSPRFTTYTSDTNVSMVLPEIYAMEPTVYSIDSAALRFGIRLEKDFFQELFDAGYSFGVELSYTKNSIEYFKDVAFTSDEIELVGDKYQFAAVLTGLENGYLDTEFTGKVYVEKDGVKIEAIGSTYSVKSLANHYSENQEELNDKQKETIGILCNLLKGDN